MVTKRLAVALSMLLALVLLGAVHALASDPGVTMSFSAGDTVADGLAITNAVDDGDGPVSYDSGYLSSVLNKFSTTRYIYVKIDDDYASDLAAGTTAKVSLEVMDEGKGSVQLQYDSWIKGAPMEGAYGSSKPVRFGGTGGWATMVFDLNNVRFANRQNGGADFRIMVGGRDITIRKITVVVAGA